MNYKISFEARPNPADLQVLGDGIMDYAKQKKDQDPLEFFTFFIRDSDNKILGGCNGNTLYGSLYIDQLWLTEALRNKGYGAQLINNAEQFGIEKGCTFATVNTMDWEALTFYQKLGYEIEFERHGFAKNSIFYFLRKPLTANPTAPYIIETDNNNYTITLVDEIDQKTDQHMSQDQAAYESSHGINVNYSELAIIISNENKVVFGVLNVYTAYAEIYVDDLWVDSAYRGKGYGKKLIQALENHFKGHGFNNINLVTSAFQAPEFYKKCGFEAEFTRVNKKNPLLSKTFFVKYFEGDQQTQGLL